MTTQQGRSSGQSRFAERGLSHEERMPEDDSKARFPKSRSAEVPKGRPVDTQELEGRAYGSGGSYGYGGAFEHGGQRGYVVTFQQSLAGGGAAGDRYEAQGKFGRDTEGYQREGIGHPGKDEERPTEEATEGAPADHTKSDDARKGYSQESGYVQSGGNPAPGGKHKSN